MKVYWSEGSRRILLTALSWKILMTSLWFIWMSFSTASRTRSERCFPALSRSWPVVVSILYTSMNTSKILQWNLTLVLDAKHQMFHPKRWRTFQPLLFHVVAPSWCNYFILASIRQNWHLGPCLGDFQSGNIFYMQLQRKYNMKKYTHKFKEASTVVTGVALIVTWECLSLPCCILTWSRFLYYIYYI